MYFHTAQFVTLRAFFFSVGKQSGPVSVMFTYVPLGMAAVCCNNEYEVLVRGPLITAKQN